jgi:hypothetical protein
MLLSNTFTWIFQYSNIFIIIKKNYIALIL